MRLPTFGLLLSALIVLPALCCAPLMAQDVRYISDKQYIPLRTGAGNQYRIVHRGLPSGTRLRVARLSDDGEWAEITTDGGTSGWLRAQYLMQEPPAQNQVDDALRRASQAAQRNTALSEEVASLKSERDALLEQVNRSDSQLGDVSEELAQLEKISGNAVQLDVDNRRLVVETETLRSEVETLESENQRLQDKLQSQDFLNGALSVLLGVIITLVVPRLWPKRRRNSSWA